MKKIFLLLSFLTTLTSNIFASNYDYSRKQMLKINPPTNKTDIYKQKNSPEVNSQVKKLLKEVQNLTQTLKEDEEKRNAFMEKLTEQQLELINKIENSEANENIIKFVQNFGSPTTPVVQEITTKTCCDNPEKGTSEKVFQIFTNLTSPKSIMATAAVIISLQVKGIITSGELTKIFEQLATIARWQTIGGITSNVFQFLTQIVPSFLKTSALAGMLKSVPIT